MAGELADEEFHPYRAEELQEARQQQRRDAIDAEHVDRCRVVAEYQGPALTGSPVQALPAKTPLPVRNRKSSVSVQELKLLDRQRSRRRRQDGYTIRSGHELPGGEWQRWNARRSLQLAAHIANPPSRGGVGGEACDAVPALPVRPSKIVDLRLCDVVAVGQRHTGDVFDA